MPTFTAAVARLADPMIRRTAKILEREKIICPSCCGNGFVKTGAGEEAIIAQCGRCNSQGEI